MTLAFALAAALAACRAQPPAEVPPVRPIADVIAARSGELMAIPGVVGVYEGLGRGGAPCVRVMVEKRTRALESKLPKTLDGWPVEIEAGGPVRPMDTPR